MDRLNLQSSSSWPTRLAQEERQFCNKLQAHKSSFQAWKTVSFGCSLLALFLIACKWREVSNDLNMLTGIELMLAEQQNTNKQPVSSATSSLSINNTTTNDIFSSNNNSPTSSNLNHDPQSLHLLITRPVPGANVDTHSNQAAAMKQLAETLSLLNPSKEAIATNGNFTSTNELGNGFIRSDQSSSDDGKSSSSGAPSIDTIIRDQIHLFLSQEFNANHLLRLELELFSAEFRSSKLTLLLSLILVAVYIVSWMLMTLAIKDTQISNDISLRNILLLSIFGAIDIAASVAFIMIRLIMYSVKNNPFASDLLQAVGLKDSPIKLNADQATSFAALRLVAMRSSAANVDLFVGSLVTLITILRLYAIARALTYYRKLRQVNNCFIMDANRNNYMQNMSQSTSLSTSRRSSAATTNLEQPLGLNLSHHTTLDGFLHQQPHSYQYGTSNAKSLWSPPARPSSYNPMAPNNGYLANSKATSARQTSSNSHNNLNQVGNLLISDNPIGSMSEQQQQQQMTTAAKYVVLQSGPISNNNTNHDFLTLSNGRANKVSKGRRHASVEAMRHDDLIPGSSLLLVQADDKHSQRQSRAVAPSKRPRQRASSSPRLVISVNPDGANKQQPSFNDNATLSASNLFYREELQQQQHHNAEPVQILSHQDSAAIFGNPSTKPRKESKILYDSRKSVPNYGEIYHTKQESNIENQTTQRQSQKQQQQQPQHHILTRSSLQDLILQSSDQAATNNTKLTSNNVTAEIISSPIKAFRTLRNKTNNVVPTLYTLLSPSSMSLINQDTETANKRDIALSKTTRTMPNAHHTQQATKYKLVARYRQLNSIDSNTTGSPLTRVATAATATTTTATANSSSPTSSSSSSMSCGPDDSDASISSQIIPINGRRAARYERAAATAGMKHSDEFVMSSIVNGTLINAVKNPNRRIATAVRRREKQQQQTIVMSANDDDDDDQQDDLNQDQDENGNNNNTIKASDNVLLGKYYYYT